MRARHRLRSILTAALLVTAGLGLTACDDGTQTTEPTPTPTPTPVLELSDLLTAPVPSLCEHPAGDLVDGELPGIDPMDGRVTLAPELIEQLKAGETESGYAVTATDADGETYLAAALYCDRGGVSWPGRVVVWNDELEPVVEFHPEEVTGGDREPITGIEAVDDGLRVRWIAANDFDAACCQQLSVEAGVRVSVADGTAVPGEPTIYRGEDQVRAVFAAGVDGGTADGVEVADGIYDGIATVQSNGGVFHPDETVCKDSGTALAGTIVCGVPVDFAGEKRSFIVYPTLAGVWNEYALSAYELELW